MGSLMGFDVGTNLRALVSLWGSILGQISSVLGLFCCWGFGVGFGVNLCHFGV